MPQLNSEETQKMQDEINKLKNENKTIKAKCKHEIEVRKNWQEITKKKEDELGMYRD